MLQSSLFFSKREHKPHENSYLCGMEVIYLFIGIVIGGVLGFFWTISQRKSGEGKLMLLEQQLDQVQKGRDDLQAQLSAAVEESHRLTEQVRQVQIEREGLSVQLQGERKRNEEQAQLHEKLHNEQFRQQQEQFHAQLETLQEQFSNLAQKVLDQTTDKLKSQNVESMQTLTAPLKQNIEQLHQAIQHTNQETAKNTASLSQQLKEMSEQTHKIDSAATQLTNVIRGGSKVQGNWGERMLTEILDAQGLKKGIDYDVQQTLSDEKGNALANDDSGKKMIPDVILHYPNNEDVIIDSKMSIEAYYQYVKAEDGSLKRKYADDLVRSIRTQMTGLSKKDYSKYVKPPRHSIDFVIMFVPNEGALQLALAQDPRLWGEAFDKNVFITSQQNLMAILKIVRLAWRQYNQSESQKKVFEIAEELLKRVGEFIKRFDKVGKDIKSLSDDYEFAYNKAYSGKQSIVKKATELKDLGVKESVNQPIPDVEPERLE